MINFHKLVQIKEKRPFDQILQCIPLCDTITKLHAMDMVSKDGSSAMFTKRIQSKHDSDNEVFSDWRVKIISKRLGTERSYLSSHLETLEQSERTLFYKILGRS